VVRVIPVYSLKFAFNDTFKEMVKKPGQKELNFYQLMISGSLAGLFQQSATFPLEFIRTRLSITVPGSGLKYNGIFDCVKSVFRDEGITAFYKGFSVTLISGTPYVGLQMTFYELFKRVFPKDTNGQTILVWKLACGAAAGLAAQTITFPGDTIRRRMMANGAGGSQRIYKSSWDCFKTTTTKEGWSALWKGLSTNLVRCVPGAAIEFATYETIKGFLGI